MKKADIVIGGIYAVKVSGRIVPVRITRPGCFRGWEGKNLETGRMIQIKSAARLRYRWCDSRGAGIPQYSPDAFQTTNTNPLAR